MKGDSKPTIGKTGGTMPVGSIKEESSEASTKEFISVNALQPLLSQKKS